MYIAWRMKSESQPKISYQATEDLEGIRSKPYTCINISFYLAHQDYHHPQARADDYIVNPLVCFIPLTLISLHKLTHTIIVAYKQVAATHINFCVSP
jgi:hypothetical protein